MITLRTELVLSAAAETPSVSPTGKWLAFSSPLSGRPEVFLHDLSSYGSPHTRISANGGRAVRWRGDEQELFYLSVDAKTVMSATPRRAGQWDDPVVTELFQVTPSPAPWIVGFDVSRDGQKFLISTFTPGANDGSLHVIVGAN